MLSTVYQQDEGHSLNHLIKFIDYNPHSIISFNLVTKEIYPNLAAKAKFPTLPKLGIEHPLLKKSIETIMDYFKNNVNLVILANESHYQSKEYEIRLFSIDQQNIIYIYITDISLAKKVDQKLQDFAQQLAALTEEKTRELQSALDRSSRQNRLLKQSKDNVNFALNAALVGTWMWYTNQNIITLDDMTVALFDDQSIKSVYTMQEFLNIIHPKDRLKLRSRFQSLNAELHDFKLRIKSNNQYICLSIRGSIQFDEAGNPLRMTGICFGNQK